MQKTVRLKNEQYYIEPTKYRKRPPDKTFKSVIFNKQTKLLVVNGAQYTTFTVQHHMHGPASPSHLEQILASPDAWDKERGTSC